MGRSAGSDRPAQGRRLKLPKYVKAYRVGDRSYFYFRLSDPPVRLPGLPWSPEFMEAHAKAMVACKAPGPVVIGASRTAAGSVSAGLLSYYLSGDFKHELAKNTQGARRAHLERFRAEHGDKRLRNLERRHVQAYINSLKKPSIQRSMLQALKGFLGYCVKLGLVADNPAIAVTRAKLIDTGGFYAWTEEDVAKFEARHPVGSKARLALALYLNLGVRKSDVVRIGPRNVKDGVLTDFLPKKGERTGGNRITVPLFAETLAIIKATPVTGTQTYLINDLGNPFTVNGFGNKMRQWCNEAGLPDCSSHGLRKLCLIRHAENGATVFEIAAISGHKNLKEIQTYVEAANRKRLARDAISKLEARRSKDQIENTTV